MVGGTRSYEMARRLVAMGHEVHMVTSWRDSCEHSDWFVTEIEGICVHWLPVPYSNHMSFGDRTKAFLKFALSSAKKASSLKSDLVFATSTPLTIALPAVYAARKQGIPMVFEVRDLWPELPIAMGALKNPVTRFLAKRLEKFAYKNSQAVVALSPGMRDGVVNAGYSAENVAVIPNSSDVELFDVDSSCGDAFRAQRDWLGTRPLVIYAGTFGLINGVGYMVQVAKQLQKISPEIRILLLGGGFEYDKVVCDAKQAGVLNNNLFIEKSIPKKEIPAAMSAADMICSLFIDKPEMQPNSANKFFDALAAGKPVMINYGGWQKDLLESSGAGIVTWGLSDEQAALKLADAIQDQNWLKTASESSRKMAEELFNRDVLAVQLEKVIVTSACGQSETAAQIAPGNYLTHSSQE